MKSGYIGSVRFYKNMILLFFIIAILVPTGFAIGYRGTIREMKGEISGLQEQSALLQQLEAENAALELAIKEKEEERIRLEAEAPDYQKLYPDFYAPQPFAATERKENVVYLTFDDGPSYCTDEILDILEKKGAKATFFVVGQSREENLRRMRRIVEEGHAIGMHSFTHEYSMIYGSVEEYLADMYAVFCQIKETTGVTPTLFRFPGGSINGYNSALYQEMIAEMIRRGFVPYDWNVSSEDAASGSMPTSHIVDSVLSGVSGRSRSIVLMHDSGGKGTTVSALSQIIDRLQAKGLQLEALSPEDKPVLFGYSDDK
ncbi:MAG: polysaccharide deacetylase family protein [Oscillospiraceae bacterium]|nr:polysaccharide deacetylase family protein [Oscillospiraceae bacterium]